MARRTLHLPALLGTLAAAVLVACAVVLLAVSEKAEATFPGKNGRIAYSAYDGNDYEIYTTNSRGGDKFQVTNNNRDDVTPSYSPDGKKIAYMVYSNATGNTGIYTIYVGGGGRTKVTNGGQPAYSPDGKKLVYWDYHKTSSNPHPDTEIYTINASGGEKTQLTHNNNDEFTPDYSPDGKRIIYAGLEGLERNNAESDIYTIKVGGGGKTKLTHNSKYDTYPSYSPDGKKIAYTVSKGSTGGDIYTINAFGGGKTQVTNNNVDEGGPSWGSRP